MTEEEIAGIFDPVAQDLDDPWIGDVIRQAERDAGRIRRRHRAYAAAGSVLAVVAIAAAGAAVAILPRSAAARAGTAQTTAMVAQLRTMLPANATISDVRSYMSGLVEFDYNDGQGAVDFQFAVEPASFCKSQPVRYRPGAGPRMRGHDRPERCRKAAR